MSPFVARAIIILLADAVLSAESKEEIYELLAKLANEDEVILEPYHAAKEKKEKKIPMTYKTAKAEEAKKADGAAKEESRVENGEEVKWHDFPEERLLFYFDRN